MWDLIRGRGGGGQGFKPRAACCAKIVPGAEKKFNSFHCPKLSAKMQVESVWGYHLIIVWTLKLTAFALCDKTNEVDRYHSIHAAFLYLYHFRDRSIPELDEILDAKLSEVQDHMRTLMQKQVGMFQPLYFLVLFCCSSGYLFLGWLELSGQYECDLNVSATNFFEPLLREIVF